MRMKTQQRINSIPWIHNLNTSWHSRHVPIISINSHQSIRSLLKGTLKIHTVWKFLGLKQDYYPAQHEEEVLKWKNTEFTAVDHIHTAAIFLWCQAANVVLLCFRLNIVEMLESVKLFIFNCLKTARQVERQQIETCFEGHQLILLGKHVWTDQDEAV